VAETDDTKIIEHIISVQADEDGYYMIETIYPETDALNAVGQVIQTKWDAEGDYDCILNTNDTLAAMWRSPAGNLWIGSSRGNVWTTAPVSWPAHRMQGLQFEVAGSHFKWSVTTLPNMATLNYRPNVTAIWGTDDANVFCATYKGIIYHWDGINWLQMPTGTESCLNHIHGSAKDYIYCVGHDAAIFHYDGQGWSRVSYPGDASENEVLTGVRVLETGQVFVCGRGGTILQGGGQDFKVLARYTASFYAIGSFQNRFFLAAGDSGVWELEDDKASVIKSTVPAVGIFESPKFLFFIKASQEPRPCVVIYDPTDSTPWYRSEF
jgi:hypothetical protein